MSDRIDILYVLFEPGEREPNGMPLSWWTEQIGRLTHEVSRNYDGALAFHCLAPSRLSDRIPWGVNHIEARCPWDSKHRKLEMFRGDLLRGRRVVYLDLDTRVVGRLNQVFGYRGKLGIRREFSQARNTSRVQSSVILYPGGSLGWIYQRALSTERMDVRYKVHSRLGDQGFLSDQLTGDDVDDLEEIYPGHVSSYRWGSKEDAALLVYHGRSKREIGR